MSCLRPSPRRTCLRGRSAGSFLEQWLVIEPMQRKRRFKVMGKFRSRYFLYSIFLYKSKTNRVNSSLRSKHFRGVVEERETEEQDFCCFTRQKSRPIFRAGKTPKMAFPRLLPNPTQCLLPRRSKQKCKRGNTINEAKKHNTSKVVTW